LNALDFASKSTGRVDSGMSLPMIKELGSPFEFARLARPSGHVLQLEHSLEDLGNDCGHQLRAKGPGQNITTDVTFLGARVIDLRGLHECTLLDGHENRFQDGKLQDSRSG